MYTVSTTQLKSTMVTEAETHPEHKDKIKERDAGVRGRAASSPKVKRMASIPEEPIEMLPRPRVDQGGVKKVEVKRDCELEPEDDPPCMDDCELQTQEHSEHVLEYVKRIREAIMLQGIRVQREEEEETLKEIVECEVTKPDVHDEKKRQETQKKKNKRESVLLAVSVKTKDVLTGLKTKRQTILGTVEAKSEDASSKIKSVGNKISRALSTRRGVEGGSISTGDSTAKPNMETEMEKTGTDGVIIATPPPPPSSQDSRSEKDDDKELRHVEFKSEIDVLSDTDTNITDDDGDDEDAALLHGLTEDSSSVLADPTSRSKQTTKRYRSPTPYGYRTTTTSDGHGRRHRLPVRSSTTGVIRKGFGVARGVVGDVNMTAKNVFSVHRKIGGWSKL